LEMSAGVRTFSSSFFSISSLDLDNSELRKSTEAQLSYWPLFWIRALILVWIRIRASDKRIRILLFSSVTFKMPIKKHYFLKSFFLLINFGRYIYIILHR
jgi:hypothetical protein